MTFAPVAEVLIVVGASGVVAWAITYLMHSTVLIGAAALVHRSGTRSSLDRVHLWRLAITAPFASGGVVRVFLHEDRLFANVPGQGEAELFALSPLEFTVLVEAGVSVTFRENPPGTVTGLRIVLGRMTIEASRR